MIGRATAWLAAGIVLAGPATAEEFGAIAFSQSTEAYGFSHNYSTRRQAENVALNACAERAGDCRIAVWFYDMCGALAVGDGDGWGAAYEGSQSAAQSSALNYCRQNTTGCRLELSFCSW